MKILSYSGGKDSTAMLLRMLELGEQIDRIVFADTGFEFPELYEYIKRIEKHIGREIEIVKPSKSFESWAWGKITRGKQEGKIRGFPMVVNPCYWTREAKIIPMEKLEKEAECFYVGIAYDEQQRVRDNPKIRYPLVEWKWTEADCITYLNKKGLLNPLYVNFNRLGCWMCPKQGEGSLFVLWKNYPELWKKLKEYEKKNYELTGRFLKMKPLQEYEEVFSMRGKPSCGVAKYSCWEGCEGVKKAFYEEQDDLNKYIDNKGDLK